MKLLRTALTSIALASSFMGAVQASPLFLPGRGTIGYENFENLYRAVDSTTGACLGCLAAVAGDPVGYRRIDPSLPNNVAVNDVFIGILTVKNIFSTSIGGDSWGQAAGDRFTGYFAQQVKAIGIDTPTRAHITLGTVADQRYRDLHLARRRDRRSKQAGPHRQESRCIGGRVY